VHEVPGFELPLLTLNQEPALAREHEEVFLIRLTVINRARLPRPEDSQIEADLREGQVRVLEPATGSVPVVRHPGGVADVDDEPALVGRQKA